MAISVERWRELMGAEATGLTDAEVARNRDQYRDAARVFLSVYDDHRRSSQGASGPTREDAGR